MAANKPKKARIPVFRVRTFISAAAVLMLVSIALYGFVIEVHTLTITRVDMRNEPEFSALKGKKIVHLTDTHISSVGRLEQKILDALSREKPDMILLTGDYISWKGPVGPAISFLSQLHAPDGVYAVLGDYDYTNTRGSCLFCHDKNSGRPTSRHSVKVLRNGSAEVAFETGCVRIHGMDGPPTSFDPFFTEQGRGEKPGEACLILIHNPLLFDVLDPAGPCLVFAGNTHGGQIKLPRWVFKIFGYEKNARYNQGLFKRDNHTMIVSRGTGTSHLPFRFLSPPELVVIEF